MVTLIFPELNIDTNLNTLGKKVLENFSGKNICPFIQCVLDLSSTQHELNSLPIGIVRSFANNFLFNDLISCHTTELKYRYFVEDYCAVSGVENTLPKFFFENCFYNPVFSDSRPQGVLYVKPRSLTDIIQESGIEHFDLLSLDVEGHEYEVLQSWDFSIPIDIILIEQLGLEKDRDELCRQILLNNGYKFDIPYQHNEIFIRIGSQYD